MTHLASGLYLVSRGKMAGTITHYGILMKRRDGRARVFHFSQVGCRLVPLVDFAAGDRIRVYRRLAPDQVRKAIARAENFVRERRPYNVLTNNCEHAARWVAEGRRKSGQGDRAGTVGLVLLGLGVAASI